MEKISTQETAHLLKTAGSTIRTLNETVTTQATELAALHKEKRAGILAKEMEDKGLNADLSFEEKVAALQEQPDLSVAEEAVKMASPQGVQLANVGEKPGSADHPFVTFIETGETQD